MTGKGEIPRRIKKGGTSFKGLSIREAMIVVVGLSLAMIAAVALAGLAVWVRAGLAVLLAGVSLALAFGTHRGQTAEELLIHWVTHRLRPRRMVWRRGGDDIPSVVVAADDEAPGSDQAPETETAPRGRSPFPRQARRDWVPLGYALVNAVMLAAMASITVYLSDGGVEELKAWWAYKLR